MRGLASDQSLKRFNYQLYFSDIKTAHIFSICPTSLGFRVHAQLTTSYVLQNPSIDQTLSSQDRNGRRLGRRLHVVDERLRSVAEVVFNKQGSDSKISQLGGSEPSNPRYSRYVE